MHPPINCTQLALWSDGMNSKALRAEIRAHSQRGEVMIVVPEARFSLTGFGADAAQAVHLQVGVGDGHRSKTAAPENPAHSVRPAKQMHLQIPDAPDSEYVSFCISLEKALHKFPGASRRVLYRIPFIFCPGRHLRIFPGASCWIQCRIPVVCICSKTALHMFSDASCWDL